MSGAEWPENARETVFGSRSELFEKLSKMGPEKNKKSFFEPCEPEPAEPEPWRTRSARTRKCANRFDSIGTV